MFNIIIQLSRFFKDFSDFETNFTPDFRHPPIKGGPELTEIGLINFIIKIICILNLNKIFILKKRFTWGIIIT